MADTITQKRYLDINLGFADEDTRKIKLENPKAEVTTAMIQAVDTAFINSSDTTLNLVVGDRAGAEFTGILTVDSIRATETEFDLTDFS